MVNRREPTEGVPSIVTGLVDDKFNESESEEELSDFDRSNSTIGDDVLNNAGMNVCDRIRINLDGLNMDGVQLGELFDSDKSKTLNNAHELDSNGKTWLEFNIETNMNNPKLEIGLLFPNKDSIKKVVRLYGRVNNHCVKFPKNYYKRLKAVCKPYCS
ncbi:hypothetical protein J1N35_010850 [Gossypium stocksii]|uniref:Transposase MuDR plant domain-containing protein n=1 Tax=Gossypium stocksii TaxID=47602 RepID=A0A9D4AAY1_9ROSI|nr:hypothetical protein J1N35_010850 [Gossypium stocksii]